MQDTHVAVSLKANEYTHENATSDMHTQTKKIKTHTHTLRVQRRYQGKRSQVSSKLNMRVQMIRVSPRGEQSRTQHRQQNTKPRGTQTTRSRGKHRLWELAFILSGQMSIKSLHRGDSRCFSTHSDAGYLGERVEKLPTKTLPANLNRLPPTQEKNPHARSLNMLTNANTQKCLPYASDIICACVFMT